MTTALIFWGAFWLALAAFGTTATGSRGRWVAIAAGLFGPLAAYWLVQSAYFEGSRSSGPPRSSASNVGKTRVAVARVAVPLSTAGSAVTFGGDPQQDDIVIRKRPTHLVRIVRLASGALALNVLPGAPESGLVRIDGQPPHGQLPARFTLAIAPPPADSTQDSIKKALSAASVFVVRYDAGLLNIAPRSGPITLTPSGDIDFVSADQSDTPRRSEKTFVLEQLGASFGPLLEKVQIVLPSSADTSTYVRGANSGTYPNDAVALRSDGREVVLNVDLVTLDTGLRNAAGWLVLLVLLVSGLVTWRERSSQLGAAFVFGTAEILLAFRTIVAIDASVSGQTARASLALADAVVALPGGLLVVAAALVPWRRVPLLCLIYAALIAVAVLAIYESKGAIPGSVWLTAAIVAGLTMVSATIGANLPRFGRWTASASAMLSTPDPDAPGIVARLRRRTPAMVLGLAVAGLALLGLRGALAAARVKEAIWIGDTRIGLSMAVVPLTLLVVAVPISRLARGRGPEELWEPVIGLLAFLLLGVLGANIVAGDSGLGLVLFASLSVVMATAIAANGGGAPWLAAGLALVAGLAMALALIAVLNDDWFRVAACLTAMLVLAGLCLWRRNDQTIGAALPSALALAPLALCAALLALVPQSPAVADAGGSDIQLQRGVAGTAVTRLSALYAPEKFAGMTSIDAANLKRAIVHLRAYTAADTGREFLGQPVATELKGAEFDDFLAAIHIISPFGRMGAAGLILLLGGFAVAACGIAAKKTAGGEWLGAAAAVTLAVTSTYIILGNALDAPFTGRNVYLLAALSQTDLIEGLTLLTLTALMLGRREQA